jgi:hypothetical protein
VRETRLGHIVRRRHLPPVGLADEDDPSGAQAPRQELDGAGDPTGDPGGTDTGCDTGLLVGDIAGSIAVDERDAIGDAEFFGTALACAVNSWLMSMPVPVTP